MDEPASEVLDAVEAEETAQESTEKKNGLEADAMPSTTEPDVSSGMEDATKQQEEHVETAVEAQKAAAAEKENVVEAGNIHSSVPSAKRSLDKEQPLEEAVGYSGPSEQPWKLVTTKRGRYN